jgi:hypothetical protein
MSPVQPSRTVEDLRPREAAHMVQVAHRSLEDAAALTVTWSRRQLIDVCLTLALGVQPERVVNPVKAVAPLVEYRHPRILAHIGPRYEVSEAAWTDTELRDAHSAWNRGERDQWATQGEQLYQRLRHRRRRAQNRRSAS